MSASCLEDVMLFTHKRHFAEIIKSNSLFGVSNFTSASSTTKTGRHDIAEILLKVVLKHQKSNQIKMVRITKSFLFS
jgi:hypothetical protein